MGGGLSTLTGEGISQDWLEIFTAMGLSTNDVKTLYKVFDFIDNESEGNITIRKVLTLLDIQRTRFNERIFSIFDKNSAGRVDLYGFVVSLWKFCSLVDSATIYAFIFEMYDTDADGKLSMDEVERLFKEFFLEDKTVFMLELMKKTDAFGMVHIKHFLSFCKPRQQLFSAVFTVQKGLQEATLGVSGWKSVGGRVIGIHFGLSLPVTELIALHNDRVTFRNLLDMDLEVPMVTDVVRAVLQNTVQPAFWL